MIAQTLRDAVPERELRVDVDVGRGCSGWASGVVGAVDRWLSGPAGHSSAQAVIAQTPRDAFPSGRCRSLSMWVGGVVVARVVGWVPWIASCLVGLATRALKPWPRRRARRGPERVRQIAADEGRRCRGCASGVLGAVDRWLSGPASHSSAQAVITQTLLRDAVPERALQIDVDGSRTP